MCTIVICIVFFRHYYLCYFFFFFKEHAPPKDPPSSPTRPSPDPTPASRTILANDRHKEGEPVMRRNRQQGWRSEEHTSELQSPCNLVCRLLLEKKKKKISSLITL